MKIILASKLRLWSLDQQIPLVNNSFSIYPTIMDKFIGYSILSFNLLFITHSVLLGGNEVKIVFRAERGQVYAQD